MKQFKFTPSFMAALQFGINDIARPGDGSLICYK